MGQEVGCSPVLPQLVEVQGTLGDESIADLFARSFVLGVEIAMDHEALDTQFRVLTTPGETQIILEIQHQVVHPRSRVEVHSIGKGRELGLALVERHFGSVGAHPDLGIWDLHAIIHDELEVELLRRIPDTGFADHSAVVADQVELIEARALRQHRCRVTE